MDNKKHDFDALVIHPIARIYTDFPSKFGIPRQGDVVSSLPGKIIFEKEYRKEGILRGLDGFSHVWLVFGFSENDRTEWSPTIRPPKLGGNERVGVFASRSTFRPNPLGMSAVKIDKIEENTKDGPILSVLGADLVSGTPIYDIKPYVPYADCVAEAKSGFAKKPSDIHLTVSVSEEQLALLPEEKRTLLVQILEQDPRPGFQHENDRNYAFEFASFHIVFHVVDNREVIVTEISKVL